jgi:hypothetical protein
LVIVAFIFVLSCLRPSPRAQEKREELKAEFPDADAKEITKKLNGMWKKLPKKEREVCRSLPRFQFAVCLISLA